MLTKPRPKMFKSHRGAVMTFRPQDGDHFAKGTDSIPVPASAREDGCNKALEKGIVRPSRNHKPGERLFGVKRNIIALAKRGLNVEARSPKPKLQRETMRWRGYYDNGLARLQTGGDEPRK